MKRFLVIFLLLSSPAFASDEDSKDLDPCCCPVQEDGLTNHEISNAHSITVIDCSHDYTACRDCSDPCDADVGICPNQPLVCDPKLVCDPTLDCSSCGNNEGCTDVCKCANKVECTNLKDVECCNGDGETECPSPCAACPTCPGIGEISQVCEKICNDVADSCLDCPETVQQECDRRGGELTRKVKKNGSIRYDCKISNTGTCNGTPCTVAGLTNWVDKCYGNKCSKNKGLLQKNRSWLNSEDCPNPRP